MTSIISRRTLLKSGTAALSATALAASFTTPAFAAGRTIKIGVVSPETGPMAAFAEPTSFVLAEISKAMGGTINVGGVAHPFEFIVRDTQSNPNRAAEVTQDLILSEAVDIVLCYGGPENANPASDQCELNGVPCIASDLPIEPWFYGRGGNPDVGFDYTFCAFFDVPSYIMAMEAFLAKLDTNKIVGGLWPNDADGVAVSGAVTNIFGELGYDIIDPGRFDLPAGSYATQIAEFRAKNADIVQGVMPPPAFTLFWTQCAQQGYQPKAVIGAKSSEYPASVNPLGDKAIGISVPVWWTPKFPYPSSITSQSSMEIARSYEKASGRQWTAGIGSRHAMVEVIMDALSRTHDIDDPDSVRDALAATDIQTVCGQVNFTSGPVPNSSQMGVVMVQWDRAPEGYAFPLDMLVVDNTFQKAVSIDREPFPIPYS